jgi:hypothetical protein
VAERKQLNVENAEPSWINMSHEIKKDFLDAVARIHNIDAVAYIHNIPLKENISVQ